MKFLGCPDCIQYQTRAVFFIDSTGEAGLCHLLVLYENGHPRFERVFQTIGLRLMSVT